MITLADVREWLKGFNVAKNYYVGKLDNKKEYSVGVYQRGTIQPPRRALGGIELTTYDMKEISILIHWNQNATETEKRAQYLYNQIFRSENVEIGGKSIVLIELLQNEPIDVGADKNNVYERVIELNIYYKKGIEDYD